MFTNDDIHVLNSLDSIFVTKEKGDYYYKFQTMRFSFIVLCVDNEDEEDNYILYINGKLKGTYTSLLNALGIIDKMVDAEGEKRNKEKYLSSE